MPSEKSVMVPIRIKESVLARIDAAAVKAGVNRSQFIISGATHYAEHLQGKPIPAEAIAATIPGVRTGDTLPIGIAKPCLSLVATCPRCGKATVPWGPNQTRCPNCATNYGS